MADEEFIPMSPGRNAPKLGQYKKIGPSRQQLSQDAQDKLTNDWVQNVRGTLGTYQGDGQDAYGQPYHIYKGPDGNIRYIRQGKDDFSYQIADANSRWAFGDRDFPQADAMRKSFQTVRDNPNPWDLTNGWGKDPSQMTVGEINNANTQLSAYARPDIGNSALHALSMSNAMLKDMDTVRTILHQLGDTDMNSVKQAILKGMNWTGLSPEKQADMFNTLTLQQLNKVIDPDKVHLFNRLYVTLQHLANQGADISGLPQSNEKGNQTNLPEHFSNMLADYGLLTAGKGGAGGLIAAGATKAIGAFMNAVTGGEIDVNHLRESISPALNEGRQLLYADTSNLVDSGYKVPDQLRTNANNQASAAQDEGVGPNEAAYTVSQTETGPELESGTSTPIDKSQLPSQTPSKQEPLLKGTPKPAPSASPAKPSQPAKKAPIATTGQTTQTGQNGKVGPPQTVVIPAPLGPQVIETPVIPGAQPGAKPIYPAPKIIEESAPKDQLERNTPQGTTADVQTAQGNLAQNNQPEEVSSNVEMGAPLGEGDAPGVDRLHQQEHVDALEPGTPFYWRDHPHAYVRV